MMALLLISEIEHLIIVSWNPCLICIKCSHILLSVLYEKNLELFQNSKLRTL